MNAKTRFRRKFPSKCNKPIVKWYKPHGAIQILTGLAWKIKKTFARRNGAAERSSCIGQVNGFLIDLQPIF